MKGMPRNTHDRMRRKWTCLEMTFHAEGPVETPKLLWIRIGLIFVCGLRISLGFAYVTAVRIATKLLRDFDLAKINSAAT